jgi:hypothetical protein
MHPSVGFSKFIYWVGLFWFDVVSTYFGTKCILLQPYFWGAEM